MFGFYGTDKEFKKLPFGKIAIVTLVMGMYFWYIIARN
jgi:hypothetical protein